MSYSKKENPGGAGTGWVAHALAVFVERPQAMDQIGAEELAKVSRNGENVKSGRTSSAPGNLWINCHFFGAPYIF
ncbi:MAG: hypothetical protein LBR95_05400 [Azoarcus sp.]|jgi:hypothetical protein|nr:hypothetical protein [Azoarcus sp.]